LRPLLPLAAAVVLLGALAGCDKSETYLGVARDQVRAQEDLAVLLSTVKDQASMEAARGSLRRSYGHLEELARQARKLPEPSAAVQERLVADWGPQLEASMTRLKEERARISALPGGEAFMKDLEQGK
jgi:hypothetical protein